MSSAPLGRVLKYNWQEGNLLLAEVQSRHEICQKKSHNWNFGAKKTLKVNSLNFVTVKLLVKNRETKSTLMLIDESWDIREHFFVR